MIIITIINNCHHLYIKAFGLVLVRELFVNLFYLKKFFFTANLSAHSGQLDNY